MLEQTPVSAAKPIPRAPNSAAPSTKQPLQWTAAVSRQIASDVGAPRTQTHLSSASNSPASPSNQVQQAGIIGLPFGGDDKLRPRRAKQAVPETLLRDVQSGTSQARDHAPAPKRGSTSEPSVHGSPPHFLSVSSGTLTIDGQYGMKILSRTSKPLFGAQSPRSAQELADSSLSRAQPNPPSSSEPLRDAHLHRDEVDICSGHLRSADHQIERGNIVLGGNSGQPATRWAETAEVSLRTTHSNHDKPRRLLTGLAHGLVEVSMRGAVELVTWKQRKRYALLEPSERMGDLVDDACLLRTVDDKTYAILAHARESSQLSLLQIREANETVPPIFLDRPLDKTSTNAGASAVCAMMQPGAFATGGYDHRVHFWEMPADVSKATRRELQIKHSSCVQALLPVRDANHKLVTAGADCRVNIYELASERVVNTFKVSNPVYHLHDASFPYCVLLEVAHRELQFEIRDYRLVPERPVQRFGFKTEHLQGRHTKGDVNNFVFACGDREGNVYLWDVRKSDTPLDIVNYFPGHRATQVAFRGQELVACSDDFQVKFISRVNDY
ncbi:uncharacterized protein PHACADRAFT_205891 [Phanerochaete carnosa HHB-10118-sp]|uniref:WD40 repeat-like protein n=1 Tax=Phanerochaete carnosa (strain HHB-10118-sp) TaxID=650164 RepID=K5WKI0_PHACS|nr:uncharacterized protein PHACADRAFT_205891 [Phanerochaete carnosa HHB-10118-sp]EKM59664.1 hypothetical protein PHACADRAFT_205891 [Phanerochaete carnosa HHB-10118-sp]